MAKKTVGELIREARTGAGLTQEQLAGKIDGLSASDVSKAERGEKELTQAALKAIAKATGVTQKSLLEAASGTKKTTTKKATAATTTKSATAKKTATATKSATAKKTTTAKKAAPKEEITLTAAEKRVLELYRAANAETRKTAEALLKGEKADAGIVETLLGGALDLLTGMGK